jgi:hypothetical protein
MTRPIILPEIFKSGKKIGLDPLAVVTQLTIRNGVPLFGVKNAD